MLIYGDMARTILNFIYRLNNEEKTWKDTTMALASIGLILAPGEVKPGHIIFAPLRINLIAPLSTCSCGNINGSTKNWNKLVTCRIFMYKLHSLHTSLNHCRKKSSPLLHSSYWNLSLVHSCEILRIVIPTEKQIMSALGGCFPFVNRVSKTRNMEETICTNFNSLPFACIVLVEERWNFIVIVCRSRDRFVARHSLNCVWISCCIR